MKLSITLFTSLVCLAAAFTSVRRAAAAEAPAPAPTLEQRVASLEAYVNNGDPTAALKDTAGRIPEGLATPTSSVPGPGHNGWMMTSAALVLFMTLPGLALFYGGLVRRKNVLSILAQCLGIAGLVTVLWWLFGYSLVFADVGDAGGDRATFLGNLSLALLDGVGFAPNTNYSYWVSQNVFAMYQLMFAIITPALIIGAVAERMKFSAVLLFVTLWMVIVYFPLAHMVWGVDGLMNGAWNPAARIRAVDFAGGTVVHMSSGWSALVLCLILGRRLGFPREPMPPHSMVLCMVGTGMLWVGWYGFNAGSAVASDGIAANAFTNTTLATAVASFVWAMAEWLLKGKPSVLGFCSGAVAGLVVVTPACGFILPSGAVVIGILAGLVPFLAVAYLKGKLGYDDALDTFGVHAVGGTLGALMTGFLARHPANPNLAVNLKELVTDSWFQPLVWEQLKAIGLTLALAITATALIAFAVKAALGQLRPDADEETLGLDLVDHGEEGYHTV
ncbi:MAG TPA: ammonium transporter [Verrucomicrobiota bacterium]|nr:ammonium transporter [Verrucomicrobiota bacterium]HNU52316.1 ammonium transporter [Verrucomicrobiota bacterium]